MKLRISLPPNLRSTTKVEYEGFPLVRDKDFLLSYSFFEEIPGGRSLRIALIHDQYEELKDRFKIIGYVAYAKIPELARFVEHISRELRTRPFTQTSLPIIFNFTRVEYVDVRYTRGIENYIRLFGVPRISDVELTVEL
ncbi:hypothetical protein HS7_15950 [Sulfolobales archaeon HS-7]|nr:hypothetical protein HS7_15950 [Sulfolobales archaeon HS-7]